MAEQNYYIPILKGKAGEYGCLKELSGTTKDHLIPLVEVLSYQSQLKEKENNKEPLTLTDYLNKKLIKNIETKWDKDHLFYLDFHELREITQTLPDGRRPAKYVFDTLRSKGFKCIPVTSFKAPDLYQADVKEAVQIDQRGFLVRLTEPNWYDDLPLVLGKQMPEYFGISADQIDLLIDLEFIERSSVEDHIELITILINEKIPSIKDWRSLTVGGSSFPKTLSGIQNNSISKRIPRLEWKIWNTLFERNEKLARVPSYCDYSILNPELINIDPRLVNRSAQIRYTCKDDILIVKGETVKKGGYNQPHTLSKLLVESDEYAGPTFSWGDGYIYKVARKEDGPGNPEIWRRAENSHHLAFVIDQLSSLFAA